MTDSTSSVFDTASRCFICGDTMADVTTRKITVLGSLEVEACAPCVDLPDTPEFVNELLVERLMPVQP